MERNPTFIATIYVGFKEKETGFVHSKREAETAIQSYVDRIGLCVSVTDTTFIYTNGLEVGIAVGFINYPRFPDKDPTIIKNQALELAAILKSVLGQKRISVVFPDETIMLGVNHESS